MVGHYNGLDKRYAHIPGKRIHWPGGREGPPPDVPQCGFLDDNPECRDKGKFDELHFVCFYKYFFRTA